MQAITKLAVDKLINNPKLKDDPAFWVDYAVRLIGSVEIGIDLNSVEAEEISDFFAILPDDIRDRAETNFDYGEDCTAYPRVKSQENYSIDLSAFDKLEGML